jgi:tol-pal system protein YbgF
MFRRPLLPCALLTVALGLALVVAPLPARSQDRSAQERLDRLERDLNMLQRQVYRGAPAPAAGGDGGALVNTEIRMDRLEAQMRELTGRVEEFINQIAQVRQRLEQVNGDIETRFSQGAGGSGALAAAEAAPSRPGARAARQFPPPPPPPAPPLAADTNEEDIPLLSRPAPGAGRGSLALPSAVPPPPGGPIIAGANAIVGTLTPPGTPSAKALPSGPEQLASAAPAARPLGGALPGGSATAQYNQAFGLLKQADYPAAEAALRAFVEQHPNDPMAGNAQYWLGETYYTRGRYLEAATAFAEGYKRYPKGTKAAEGLLKLGMSLEHANQRQNACVALAQLDRDFPNPGAAIKERAAAEKQRMGC